MIKRLTCWYRAWRFNEWGQVYGGHGTIVDVERVNATGAVFHEEICADCAMSFGLRR